MRRTNKDAQRKAKRQRDYHLSPEGLTALREAARQRRPWASSTGPTTAAGKERSKLNALRHGERTAARVRERHEMAELMRMLSSGSIGV